jgi:hypothetical protein
MRCDCDHCGKSKTAKTAAEINAERSGATKTHRRQKKSRKRIAAVVPVGIYSLDSSTLGAWSSSAFSKYRESSLLIDACTNS